MPSKNSKAISKCQERGESRREDEEGVEKKMKVEEEEEGGERLVVPLSIAFHPMNEPLLFYWPLPPKSHYNTSKAAWLGGITNPITSLSLSLLFTLGAGVVSDAPCTDRGTSMMDTPIHHHHYYYYNYYHYYCC